MFKLTSEFHLFFLFFLVFFGRKKSLESNGAAQTGAHTCKYAVIVCIVCLCVFPHPVMPTSPLPPSSGHARPICRIPPSIPSSIPPLCAALCPSLPLRIHPPFPSPRFFIYFLFSAKVSSRSALRPASEHLYTTRLELITTCGVSSLCDNNNNTHQR